MVNGLLTAGYRLTGYSLLVFGDGLLVTGYWYEVTSYHLLLTGLLLLVISVYQISCCR